MTHLQNISNSSYAQSFLDNGRDYFGISKEDWFPTRVTKLAFNPLMNACVALAAIVETVVFTVLKALTFPLMYLDPERFSDISDHLEDAFYAIFNALGGVLSPYKDEVSIEEDQFSTPIREEEPKSWYKEIVSSVSNTVTSVSPQTIAAVLISGIGIWYLVPTFGEKIRQSLGSQPDANSGGIKNDFLKPDLNQDSWSILKLCSNAYENITSSIPALGFIGLAAAGLAYLGIKQCRKLSVKNNVSPEIQQKILEFNNAVNSLLTLDFPANPDSIIANGRLKYFGGNGYIKKGVNDEITKLKESIFVCDETQQNNKLHKNNNQAINAAIKLNEGFFNDAEKSIQFLIQVCKKTEQLTMNKTNDIEKSKKLTASTSSKTEITDSIGNLKSIQKELTTNISTFKEEKLKEVSIDNFITQTIAFLDKELEKIKSGYSTEITRLNGELNPPVSQNINLANEQAITAANKLFENLDFSPENFANFEKILNNYERTTQNLLNSAPTEGNPQSAKDQEAIQETIKKIENDHIDKIDGIKSCIAAYEQAKKITNSLKTVLDQNKGIVQTSNKTDIEKALNEINTASNIAITCLENAEHLDINNYTIVINAYLEKQRKLITDTIVNPRLTNLKDWLDSAK